MLGAHIGKMQFPKLHVQNGHVPRSSIPNAFTKEVVTMLTPGVNQCACAREQEGSPGKSQRPDAKTWQAKGTKTKKVEMGNRENNKAPMNTGNIK
jgi:hypothetical protein